jgi:hypothetical protein
MNTEPAYIAEGIFGHVTCESFFKYVGEEVHGWGRSRWYDQNGVLQREVCAPTGCVLRYEAEPKPGLGARLLRLLGVGHG